MAENMEIERLLGYFAEVVAKYDKKLRHIMVSRKAEPIFKDSPEFYIGKTPCEVGWPDDFCAEYEKNLKKALKKKETVTAELEFALPGETKYFESRFIPAKSDNGNAEAVVCVIRDITSYKNAENNQRKSLSLISEIFESVADGILVLDSENKTVSFNKRFLDIYGITEKQAVGGNISERLGRIKKHIVNKDKFEEGLLKVLDDPEAELFDTFEFKDGRVIERRSKPQKRGDEIVGRIWMFHDITEQVDAVAERDKILNNSIDLICIADFKGYFSYINPAFEDLLGYSFAEIKGNPFFYYIHPDDLEITKKEVGKLSEGEMTLKFENRYRCSDGSYKCISWRAYPDISEGTIYAIGRDESEQKAIEKELVESRKKNSLHIEQTPMAVIDWNLNFEVENWNLAAERIFGYTSAEAIGRHASFIIPDVSRETVDSVWNGLLSKTGGTRSTNRNVTKEGKIIVCEWYNTPLVDEGGNVVGVASIAQDVTERIYIEEALRKMSVSFSNLEGEEFLNNVAMHLTESLDVDYALIGRLVENNTIKTYGLNRRGEMLDQIVYPLAGTPCEKVLGVSTCCFNYGVAREFPKDALLSEMGIEGYVGTPLFDKEGGALGIIVLLSRKPIENPYIATATLEIFAERVSSEMDRQKAKG
ncbi:MAG: PAS domain S-box protein, partial [Nitrospinota bacterium]|nr:PAS domain S-box protein [Nitrospinota bacterium]